MEFAGHRLFIAEGNLPSAQKEKLCPMCHSGPRMVCMGNGGLHKRQVPVGQCGVLEEGEESPGDAPVTRVAGGVPWQCVPSCP